MKLQAGIFLKGTPALEDTFFSRAVIFITEYNSSGAVGFIINRPFERSLHELEAYRHNAPFPLHAGGPVDTEHLFVLHQRPDLIAGGTEVTGGIYFGGNFEQVVAAMDLKRLTSNDVKILVGYCGWERGDLEAEIEEGSWVITQVLRENLFD